MAVTLRLSRHGKKKNPFYRIVATETGFRRDGKYIEIVGSYNPMQDPPLVVLKEERVKSWIENGAKPSALVRTLIKNNIGILVVAQRVKNVTLVCGDVGSIPGLAQWIQDLVLPQAVA